MPFYQPGDIVLRDYRIEAFIGEGGFGEVYRAVDLNLREAVVIKILRTDGGMADRDYEQARARFTLEGRLGHRISHPNVVRIYKFAPDEASGLLVLVMEYISGGSLADRL
ncbi:MAG TPA: protein kinase, partial [Anaerolineaceae bacterium]|nr:protein kinase [Anaerolineaceae bacterium]